jgi:hydrogenase expression/formation protein HypC
MCLSIPARVEEIQGDEAVVSVGGTTYKASLQMLDNVNVGDFILMHTGFALQKISPEEAEATLRLFKEFENFNNALDQEEKESGQRIV